MGYMTLREKWRIPRYDDPKETQMGDIAFNAERCSGCGLCIKACPADAILMQGAKVKTRDIIECMACGDCVAICKEGAIALTRSYRYSGFYKTIDSGKLTPPRI